MWLWHRRTPGRQPTVYGGRPALPYLLARAATTLPLGAASSCGPKARDLTRFRRYLRQWRRTLPSEPPTACHPHHSAWTAPRFATTTRKPDTRTRLTTKGCGACYADSPVEPRARVPLGGRRPPSQRRVWRRSARLLTCGVADPAAEPSAPARLATAVAWTWRSYRPCETPCSGRPKPLLSRGPTWSVNGHRKCPTSGEGGAEPCGGHEAVAPGGETSRAAPGRMALERSAWRRMR